MCNLLLARAPLGWAQMTLLRYHSTLWPRLVKKFNFPQLYKGHGSSSTCEMPPQIGCHIWAGIGAEYPLITGQNPNMQTLSPKVRMRKCSSMFHSPHLMIQADSVLVPPLEPAVGAARSVLLSIDPFCLSFHLPIQTYLASFRLTLLLNICYLLLNSFSEILLVSVFRLVE